MPLVYTIVASLLAVWELADVVKLSTRGAILGTNPFLRLASFHMYETLQADLEFLIDWVAIAKLLVVIGLVGSIIANEAFVRAFFSVGYSAGMVFYFVRMSASLRKVEELKELPAGSTLRLDLAMGVLFLLFAVGAALEVKEAVS